MAKRFDYRECPATGLKRKGYMLLGGYFLRYVKNGNYWVMEDGKGREVMSQRFLKLHTAGIIPLVIAARESLKSHDAILAKCAEANGRAEAAERMVAKWQDISTAPKDGTEFLAYSEKGFIFITAYLPDQCKGFGSIHSCCGYYEDLKPTKWMPLPSPPINKKDAL